MRAAIFAFFVLLATPAAATTWQEGSLADATARAAREKKLVFVDVYATWCGPCQDMDAEVYPRDEVARLLASEFVALRRDGERGEGLTIAQRYHVLGFPTMLVLDGAGAEIDRVTGGMSTNDLVRTLEKIRQGKGALPEAERALARAPTDALRAEVAQRHAMRGDPRAEAELRAVIAADADNHAHRAAPALLTLGKYVYLRGMNDYERADRTLAELEQRFPTSEEANEAAYQRAVGQARAGHVDRATKILDAWIADAPKDVERLSAYAWFCFKEGGAASAARGIDVAKRGLAIAPADAGLWDTLGELSLVAGRRDDARTAFKHATELKPQSAYFRSQLAKVGGAP